MSIADLAVANRSVDIVEVSGTDAQEFLDGQTSSDVAALKPGDIQSSLLLAPQGKLVSWLRLYLQEPNRFLCIVANGFGERVENRFKRFAIRTDVSFSRSCANVVSIRATDENTVKALVHDYDLGKVQFFDCLWPGWVGADYLSDTNVDEVGDYRAVRLLAGVPAMGVDMDEETIPAAAGLVEGSVDFNKGCFVGQELVARIDSRGAQTPTNLVKLSAEASPGFKSGERLFCDGADVGEITSAYVGDSVSLGLGYLKRVIEAPATVQLGSTGLDVQASKI